MIINELLQEENMSRYRLSKESGVPMTTITDICTGKAQLDKCAAGTLYKIAKVFGVTIDSLLENNERKNADYRCSFETFKSNTCHHVKDMGDIDFMLSLLEKDDIRKYYKRRWYPEALYLLAMLDYLSRVNNVPNCTRYDDIRAHKLKSPIYPVGVLLTSEIMKSDKPKKTAEKEAIPEFKRFNIIESEVRNVV